MRTFEIVPGDRESSVILHVPHASTSIPDEVRAGILLDDAELADELAAMTDADTDTVADEAAARAAVRSWIFVNRCSRLVVDPERFPDEREELNDSGMGAVYTRTSTGAVLRDPSSAEGEQLIDRYFTPYAEGIAQLAAERLAAVGSITIVDIHSYPQEPNPYELHQDGPRPELCIGVDDFHTPPTLVEAVRAAMPTDDTAINSPFAGCYVPMDQYQQNAYVCAVMLEIRRDVVAGQRDALAVGTAALVDALQG